MTGPAIFGGGSPVNPHPSPAAKTVVSLTGDQALTVDVYRAGEVNVALDMPEYEVEAGMNGGGHRCGAFDLEQARAFRDALSEAIEFSGAAPR